MKRRKKKRISPTIVIGLMLDILVVWYLYDFFKAGEKISGYALLGAYGFIRIMVILRTIKRMKRKKEFNELYPEN